jgi:hypothetical protein
MYCISSANKWLCAIDHSAVGGIDRSAAIRAIAEVWQWIMHTTTASDIICATRATFKESICINSPYNASTEQQYILRVPIS